MFLYGRTKEIYKMAKKRNLGKVLSAGCGDGSSTAWVKNLVGIDIDEKSIEIAQESFPKQTFLLGKVEKIPFPKEFFDTVLAMDVLQYSNEDKALSEIYRVLKPGGVVLISVPRDFFAYKILDWETWFKPKKKFKKVSFYNPKEIRKKIEGVGLIVERIYSRGLLVAPLHRFLAIPFEAFDYFVLRKKGALGPLGWAIRRFFAPIINWEFHLHLDFGYTIFIKAKKQR